MIPKVKVCCISSIEEAHLALRYGASALGLVSAMPSGPGVISDLQIKEIIQNIPETSNSFLLTSKQDIPSIIHQYKTLKPKTIQLVDELTKGTIQALKAAIPEVELVQVIHVLDEHTIEEAVKNSIYADALLLDSGNPNLKIKTLGGTGKVHDWTLSRRIVEMVDKPVWLAGGLNAGNVNAAVEQVQPHGLDLCSGLRTDGRLDEEKLGAFFRAIG